MDIMVRRIAIILARGGSKRIPRKNIIPFNGKPMLAWSIEAALASGKFAHTLVSTDDEEIAALSRAHGAEVPFLRNGAADDNASSSEATLAALAQAEQYWGEQYDTVAQLMANCPLRDAQDIVASVDHFETSGAGSQISCFRFGWMNPWWAVKLGAGGQPEHQFPEAFKARSQDLPPLYCPSGALWIARPSFLREHRTFYGAGHIFNPMPWVSAMDIDDHEDLAMAQACYLIKHAAGKQ
jgi:CMP-N-acetylneuraminic acid synthetase